VKAALFGAVLTLAAATHVAGLELHATIATGTEVAGKFVVARIDDGGHQANARVIGDCIAPDCDVELAAGHWLVQWQAAGWWSPVRSVEIPNDGNAVSLQAFPTATIGGGIVTEKGDVLAKGSLQIRFRSADGALEDERNCSIDGPAFRCEIPSGTYDLRLRASGHISHYLWGFAASPHQQIDLGQRLFRRGSSLVGSVQLAPGVSTRLSAVNVVLTPASAERLRDVQQLRGLNLTAHPNEKGFFAFDGAAPGEYELTAVSRGLLSQRVRVDVLAGKEAELRVPLVVDRPAELNVSLTPPLDPWGRKWRVEMEQERDGGRERMTLTESAADADGKWTWSRIASEPVRIVILDHQNHPWLDEELEASGPSERNIVVPVSAVRGQVKLGDKGLGPAELRFDGRSASITIDADDSGRFSGFLPRALDTPWRLHIESAPLMVNRQLEEIRFRRDADGEAALEVAVPLTHFAGSVVDGNHEPVDALVSVRGEAGELVQTKATRGSFVINGLPPGTYKVHGETFDKGTSEMIEVRVTDDGSQPDIELMLRRDDQLALNVLSDGGPVAGAMVWSIPTDAKAMIAFPLATDAAGELKRPIPGGAREFDFVIEAPGFATRLFHHRLQGEHVRIRVNPAGGSLTLSYPAPQNGTIPLVVHDGAVVAPFLLGNPACGERCSLSVTVDGGDYALCSATASTVDSLRGATLPANSCTHGFLSPGGSLQLAR